MIKKLIGGVIVLVFAVVMIVYIFYGLFWAALVLSAIVSAAIARWYMHNL